MPIRVIRAAMAAALCVCAAAAPAREVMLMNRISPSKMTLFIANADGSDERRLLPQSTGLDYDASFSSDGQWIVFTSERDSDGSGQADIWRVHPDGSGIERLTNETSMEDAGALSPDGRTLAYVSTSMAVPEPQTFGSWILQPGAREISPATVAVIFR